MIDLLRKVFIKNYKDVDDPEVRKAHGLLANVVGIITNLLLFLFKIVVGILSFSISIITDALNNLTDFLSCFVSLFGFKLSARPADKRHPYGHERIEYISGMIISFIMISTSIFLIYTSISKLINPGESATYSTLALIILGVSILVKLFLSYFYYKIGKIINSEAIKAQKQDSLNDAICTTGVLIAAIINLVYKDLNWLDPTISLLISFFILFSGIKETISSISPLIGVPLDKEKLNNIKNDILKTESVLGVHDIIAHTYGHTKIYVTAHVELDGYLNLIDAHEIIDNIENKLDEKYQIELTIHLDPVDSKNKDAEQLKLKILNSLKELDEEVSIHDFRISKLKVLSFDVLIKNEENLSEKELLTIIENKVLSIDKTYKLHIKIDFRY